jgi:hypothetical protein
LKEQGVMLQQQRGYIKKELQDFARNNQIELYKCKEITAHRLEGNPKDFYMLLGSGL